MNVTRVQACRVCHQKLLENVFDFGIHPLSSRFPNIDEDVPEGPLALTICQSCGLVQLQHDYELDSLYRHDYGYRSGINKTMSLHLKRLVENIENLVDLRDGDVVLDIGSNDGTLLKCYGIENLTRIGIDPTSEQYQEYYTSGIITVNEYFSKAVYEQQSTKKAKVITSIAMFYDLPDPNSFVADVAACLSRDGIWILEQSYLGAMLQATAFDAICHEHLEYYSLSVLNSLLDNHGLRIFKVMLNKANGGSLRIFACHQTLNINTDESVNALLKDEFKKGLLTITPLLGFRDRSIKQKHKIHRLIESINETGESICVYGASTKGNTMLNFCGLDRRHITAAADRNPHKWGRKLPGSKIPIISEQTARKLKPNYFLVLPWHFRNEFIVREKEYLKGGGKMIFPLPEVEIVDFS